MEHVRPKRVLVVAAHPDDEVLGVGGTILKHVESKDEVQVCIVTKAYEPQWTKDYISGKLKEQKAVDEVLGIKARHNIDFPTVKLNTIPTIELNQAITDVVDRVKPDLIYTHFENDLNYDHTLIFKACLVATRPPKRIKLLSFETLSETEWNNKPFCPNYWVDIEKYIGRKIEAFQKYQSEIKEFPHPRSSEGIKIWLRKGVQRYAPNTQRPLQSLEMSGGQSEDCLAIRQ